MADIVFRKSYIRANHFRNGNISDLGKPLNRNNSLTQVRMCMGESNMLNIVGIEVDKSISPQKTTARRSDAVSQRAFAVGFSSSSGPTILRARSLLLKMRKNTITAMKTANAA